MKSITPTERKILELIAEGHSSRDVAFALAMSKFTVLSHRRSLLKKFDCKHLLSFAVLPFAPILQSFLHQIFFEKASAGELQSFSIYPFSTYSDGNVPNSSLNTLLKYERFENPTSYATCETGPQFCPSNCAA